MFHVVKKLVMEVLVKIGLSHRIENRPPSFSATRPATGVGLDSGSLSPHAPGSRKIALPVSLGGLHDPVDLATRRQRQRLGPVERGQFRRQPSPGRVGVAEQLHNAVEALERPAALVEPVRREDVAPRGNPPLDNPTVFHPVMP